MVLLLCFVTIWAQETTTEEEYVDNVTEWEPRYDERRDKRYGLFSEYTDYLIISIWFSFLSYF